MLEGRNTSGSDEVMTYEGALLLEFMESGYEAHVFTLAPKIQSFKLLYSASLNLTNSMCQDKKGKKGR
jgi:hypothetical protein